MPEPYQLTVAGAALQVSQGKLSPVALAQSMLEAWRASASRSWNQAAPRVQYMAYPWP